MTARRRVLLWMAGAALAPAFGCGEGSNSTGGAGGTGGGATCGKIPEETAGPYPGDGSNGPNALTATGVVRSDIRSSFGTLTGTAEGVLLAVQLKVVSASSCAALAGRAVYLWHCDRDGGYSMYTAVNQNYLRGVQETDADGNVTFTTILPGCYPGRWPHMHFEVFASLAQAAAGGAKVATSQLALPKATCDEAYATTGYSASVGNLTQLSLANDMVFSDGSSAQVATVTGNATAGYLATLTIAVAG
jgi:protocatechuate 3,4-dioxygenase beta subunit